nr:heavy metal-associated domain-containing protein [Geomonas sp. RF6]
MKSKGVSCGSCAGKIEKALMEKPGVAAVEVDVDNGRVTAAYDSGAIKPEVIADTITGLGYGTTVVKAMSLDEYRAAAGKGDASQNAGRGGCGGGCCDKNRKAN